MRRPWVAWAGLALVLTAVIVAFVFAITQHDVFQIVAFVVLGMPFAVVGALVAARRPAEPVGWLLLGIGVSLALANTSDGIVRYGLAHPDGFVSPGYFGLSSAACFGAFFLLLILTLLLLPSGRLPSPRWRIVAAGVGVLAALDLVGFLRVGTFEDWKEEGLRNPLGVQALGSVLAPLLQVSIVMTFLLLLLSILSVAIRFRSSRGVERAQLMRIHRIPQGPTHVFEEELRRRHGRRGAAGHSRSGETAGAPGRKTDGRDGCGVGPVRDGERCRRAGEDRAQQGTSEDWARSDHRT